MYSFFQAQGATSGTARQGRGGVDPGLAFTGTGGAVAGAAGRGVIENRHTVGVDGKFTAGPFSLQPSVLYQFGNRHNVITAGFAPYGPVGSLVKADISAWLVDVRGAFNVGPLTLAAMGMWTSGDNAKSNPFKTIGFYQPLDTGVRRSSRSVSTTSTSCTTTRPA